MSTNHNMGDLARTLRSELGTDDTELRASLKQFGWHPEFPAIKDEHGHTLVGNRRMRLAIEMGIIPVFKTLTLGEGNAADAERVKLALISNIGAQPLTPADRKRIAEHLYNGGWTMQRIGEALNVNKATVSRDLEGCCTAQQPRPKGGRPKAPPRKSPPAPQTDKVQETVEELIREGKPVSRAAISNQYGVGHNTVQLAVARAKGKLAAEPHITPDMLSMSAREKAEAFIRQEKKRLAKEFRQVVEAEVDTILQASIARAKKTYQEAQAVIKAREGFMTRKTYLRILSCLHPDSRKAVTDETLATAFRMFTQLEKRILDEKESPTDFPPLPETRAEWEAAKRRAQAERRARRDAANHVATR